MKILDVPQSGSVAGVTSGRNRDGQYRRSRSSPVQPRTPNQMSARSLLSDASAAWRGLTEGARLAWHAFAANVFRTDSLGQTTSPSGHQAFVGNYCLSSLTGIAAPTVPPARATFAANTVTGVTIVAGVITIAGAVPPTDAFIVISASGPVSSGRTFNGSYKKVVVLNHSSTFPFVCTTQYAAIYGAVPLGQKVFFRFKQVTLGQADVPKEISAVATAV